MLVANLSLLTFEFVAVLGELQLSWTAHKTFDRE